ncbi:MAG: two-component system chemotaxis response regulator CheY [Candidatus Pelagisphaera sp.]|jgi:two-component system chemotaxis response regulator CheY
MKALIVDDSRVMRKMLSSYISDIGVDSTGAKDGRDGLEKLAAQSDFDIALVDWDMPHMNGLEFVKAVRANHAYDSMKVLMVTAHTAMEDVGQALEIGADDFLMKPFSKSMVENKLCLLGLVN